MLTRDHEDNSSVFLDHLLLLAIKLYPIRAVLLSALR